MLAAPRLPRNCLPTASAAASVGTSSPPSVARRDGANEPPLSEITFWKSPFAYGDAASMLTAMPPADSPKIVTLRGIAAERRDVVLDPLQARDHVLHAVVAGALAAFRESSGCARKPNAPTR